MKFLLCVFKDKSYCNYYYNPRIKNIIESNCRRTKQRGIERYKEKKSSFVK